MKGKEKLIHNSRIKRQYAKILKQEGYDVDEVKNPAKVESAQEGRKFFKGQKRQTGEQGNSSKPNPFKKALEEAERIRAERQREVDERLHKKKEVEISKAKRVAARRESAAVMRSKTKKGQPDMRGRLGLLLDKIRESAD